MIVVLFAEIIIQF